MKCIVRCNSGFSCLLNLVNIVAWNGVMTPPPPGFSCLLNLIDLGRIYIFFQNTICRNVQMKTSLKFTEFFLCGKQDQEINATPSIPAAVPTKRTWKFRKSWEARYKWLHFDGKQNKMFCKFCMKFSNGKKRNIPWWSEQITFKLLRGKRHQMMHIVAALTCNGEKLL